MKNNYIFEDDHVRIFLHRRKNIDLELLVDLEDFDLINSFDGTFYSSLNRSNGQYYSKITIYMGLINEKPKYKTMFVHRIILGCDNKKVQIDHINHNGLDNRRKNIILTNHRENAINRTNNKNNKTGYRNVCYFNGFYLIQLQVNGKNKVLAKTKDLKNAGKIAKEMRQKYYNRN